MRAAQTAMIGLAALAVTACGDPRRGDVRVFWTFSGQTCQQAAVHIVQVGIQNEVLNPNQFFCTDPHDGSLRVGADLGPFLFGTYNLTVTGFSAEGPPAFEASQSFTVRGDIDVNIDLQAVPSTVASADVSWDALTSTGGFVLRANAPMTCDEAQVDTVRIFVDPNPDGSGGTALNDLACNTNGVEGALVSPLTAGTHSFAISGIRNGTLVYKTMHPASAQFDIGLTTNVDVDADAVGSGLGPGSLTWDFSAVGATCPGPVSYTLTDPSGAQGPALGSTCTSTISRSNVTAGLWLVDATSGTSHAHVVFGVPNQSSASWSIPFSP